jgi:hypothetical protein
VIPDIPEISHYGSYKKHNYGAHTTKLRFHNFDLYYSYQTIIAVDRWTYTPPCIHRYLLDSTGLTLTTKKHLRMIKNIQLKGCQIFERQVPEEVFNAIVHNTWYDKGHLHVYLTKGMEIKTRKRKKGEPEMCPELESVEKFNAVIKQYRRSQAAKKAAKTRKERKAVWEEMKRTKEAKQSIMTSYPNLLSEVEGLLNG